MLEQGGGGPVRVLKPFDTSAVDSQHYRLSLSARAEMGIRKLVGPSALLEPPLHGVEARLSHSEQAVRVARRSR